DPIIHPAAIPRAAHRGDALQVEQPRLLRPPLLQQGRERHRVKLPLWCHVHRLHPVVAALLLHFGGRRILARREAILSLDPAAQGVGGASAAVELGIARAELPKVLRYRSVALPDVRDTAWISRIRVVACVLAARFVLFRAFIAAVIVDVRRRIDLGVPAEVTHSTFFVREGVAGSLRASAATLPNPFTIWGSFVGHGDERQIVVRVLVEHAHADTGLPIGPAACPEANALPLPHVDHVVVVDLVGALEARAVGGTRLVIGAGAASGARGWIPL